MLESEDFRSFLSCAAVVDGFDLVGLVLLTEASLGIGDLLGVIDEGALDLVDRVRLLGNVGQ